MPARRCSQARRSPSAPHGADGHAVDERFPSPSSRSLCLHRDRPARERPCISRHGPIAPYAREGHVLRRRAGNVEPCEDAECVAAIARAVGGQYTAWMPPLRSLTEEPPRSTSLRTNVQPALPRISKFLSAAMCASPISERKRGKWDWMRPLARCSIHLAGPCDTLLPARDAEATLATPPLDTEPSPATGSRSRGADRGRAPAVDAAGGTAQLPVLYGRHGAGACGGRRRRLRLSRLDVPTDRGAPRRLTRRTRAAVAGARRTAWRYHGVISEARRSVDRRDAHVPVVAAQGISPRPSGEAQVVEGAVPLLRHGLRRQRRREGRPRRRDARRAAGRGEPRRQLRQGLFPVQDHVRRGPPDDAAAAHEERQATTRTASSRR